MNTSKSTINTAWRAYIGHFATPTLVFSLVFLTLYGIVFYLGFSETWSLWLCCIINTVLSYLLFTPLHEAVHGNIIGKQRQFKGLETLIGWLCGLTLTVPFPVFRYLHLTHHTHTNDGEKDPDYWVASKNPFFIFFKCSTIIFDYYYFFFRDSKKQLSNKKTRMDFIIGTISIFLIYGGSIALSAVIGWQYMFWLWLIPALTAATFLAFAFDWLPHHPHGVQKRYLDTRIILFPGFTFFLLSQNMHLIHHLYPNIPFYQYGKVFKKMRSYLEQKGANIEDWSKSS